MTNDEQIDGAVAVFERLPVRLRWAAIRRIRKELVPHGPFTPTEYVEMLGGMPGEPRREYTDVETAVFAAHELAIAEVDSTRLAWFEARAGVRVLERRVASSFHETTVSQRLEIDAARQRERLAMIAYNEAMDREVDARPHNALRKPQVLEVR